MVTVWLHYFKPPEASKVEKYFSFAAGDSEQIIKSDSFGIIETMLTVSRLPSSILSSLRSTFFSDSHLEPYAVRAEGLIVDLQRHKLLSGLGILTKEKSRI